MKPHVLISIAFILLLTFYVFYSNTSLSNSNDVNKTDSKLKDLNHTALQKIDIAPYDLVKLIDSNQNDVLEILLKEKGVHPDQIYSARYPTALLHAAKELKTQSFLILAKYGADINYRDYHGNSALINATNANNYQSEYSKPNYKIIKYLVDNGAEINVANDYKYTPILGAIISNDLDALMLLVENGGDVYRVDRDGANYMFYARKIEIIKYLVQRGLDINSLTGDNENVIQSYMGRHTLDKKIVQQLIELGAEFCHLDDLGKSVLDYYLDKNTPHLFEVGSEDYKKRREKLRNSEIYEFLKNEYTHRCSR